MLTLANAVLCGPGVRACVACVGCGAQALKLCKSNMATMSMLVRNENDFKSITSTDAA
jgi:hypothetical protein